MFITIPQPHHSYGIFLYPFTKCTEMVSHRQDTSGTHMWDPPFVSCLRLILCMISIFITTLFYMNFMYKLIYYHISRIMNLICAFNVTRLRQVNLLTQNR